MTWLYFVHTGIYQVILRTAWYILRYTTLYLESGSSRLASPFCLGCPLVPCIACDFLSLPSLLDGQAPKAGLAAPKLPQPRVDSDFVDIAAPSSVQSSSVGTAKWEACFLALAEHVRDSRSRVTSQKQWDKRDPVHHILGRSHVEAGCCKISSGSQPSGSGAVEGSGIIASRCAPRNPAHKSISEYIPVYTCIYLSVPSIKQYIPVCTVPGQVYPSIYQYTLVYTGLYTVYLGIYYSVQSLDKSPGLSRGLKRDVAGLKRADLSARYISSWYIPGYTGIY